MLEPSVYPNKPMKLLAGSLIVMFEIVKLFPSKEPVNGSVDLPIALGVTSAVASRLVVSSKYPSPIAAVIHQILKVR